MNKTIEINPGFRAILAFIVVVAMYIFFDTSIIEALSKVTVTELIVLVFSFAIVDNVWDLIFTKKLN